MGKSYADSQMLRTAAPVLSPGMVTSFSSGLVSSGMHTSQRRVNSVGGKKIGVGVKLRRNAQGQTCVQELLQGFGAQKSGQINVEDVILSIDTQPVDGWDLDAIRNLTIGPEGSLVTLSLLRNGQPFQVSLQRCFPA